MIILQLENFFVVSIHCVLLFKMDIIQERVNDPKQQNIATTSASSYPHAQLQPSTSQSAGIVACNSQKRIINLEDDDSDSVRFQYFLCFWFLFRGDHDVYAKMVFFFFTH